MDYIFDLDGTVAQVDHRLHFIKIRPKNWPAFHAGIPWDLPNLSLIEIMKGLHQTGNRIVICTGRPESTRSDTIAWLDTHGVLDTVSEIYMRKENDTREDFVVKSEILDEILDDGYDPKAVFEDRPQVISMWREHGLFVFDCNQTGEDF